MRIAPVLAASLVSSALHLAGAQELRIYPGGPTPLYPVNPGRGYVDFVVHSIVIANTTAGPLTVQTVHIDAMRGQHVIATVAVDPDDILSASRELVEMRGQGLEAIVDLTVPSSVVGSTNHLIAQLNLPTHGALASGPVYVALHGEPTSIRIRAALADARGAVREVATTVATVGPSGQHAYAFPLRGAWFQRSVPNITSHHRWNAATEYAMDYWKLDSAGSPARGKGDTATDFYAYGQPVFAADGGTVVAVVNDAAQDYASRRRRDGESDDAYTQRVTKINMMAMVADPYRGVVGNYVVLAHANGEYSMYGHLKTGSTTVTKGARVERGQQIGQVGDTGDSPLVHLHFQIADGPDPLRARSVPFHFSDIPPDDPDLGQFVTPTGH